MLCQFRFGRTGRVSNRYVRLRTCGYRNRLVPCAAIVSRNSRRKLASADDAQRAMRSRCTSGTRQKRELAVGRAL